MWPLADRHIHPAVSLPQKKMAEDFGTQAQRCQIDAWMGGFTAQLKWGGGGRLGGGYGADGSFKEGEVRKHRSWEATKHTYKHNEPSHAGTTKCQQAPN